MSRTNLIRLIVLVIIGLVAIFLFPSSTQYFAPRVTPKTPFQVQSIDTMKYSRDMAQDRLYDYSFNSVIDRQIQLIADSGATHVSIATPYDKEFVPFLKRWVDSARAHGLNVWFRGNFSGWEGWFGYSKISRATHEKLLKDFILNNPDLFKDGDIFTACHECENGGPGDPRTTGDRTGYNNFLIEEHAIVSESFKSINKEVSDYPSMNADIANYILNSKTIDSLGGTILVDHYASSAYDFLNDFNIINNRYTVNVGVGELGAPIPDLNGNMTETEQAKYVAVMLDGLYKKANQFSIVNYWVLQGGSTAIVNDDGTPREAYYVVKSYYDAPKVSGSISSVTGERVEGAKITVASTTYATLSDASGMYSIFLAPNYRKIIIEKEGYDTQTIDMPENLSTDTVKNITLQSMNPPWWYKAKIFLLNIRSKMYVAK